MTYDVLLEPWIKVLYKNGAIRYIGIRQLFLDAHLIDRIKHENVTETFGIHRFLVAFASDMIEADNINELFDLWDDGRFDTELFEAYVQKCRSEGVTFDLFDQDRPFMLQKFDPNIDDTQVSTAMLVLDQPTGNNAVHVCNQLEEDFPGLTPGEAFSAYLSLLAFPIGGIQKGRTKTYHLEKKQYWSIHPVRANGGQAIYYLALCDNLFQSIMCAVKSKLECHLYGSLNDVPILYRNTEVVDPGSIEASGRPVNTISYVYGLTFPNRRLVLPEPDDTGRIKKCWLYTGFQLGGNENQKIEWVDPYTASRVEDKKDGTKVRIYINATEDRGAWRDIGAIANTSNMDGKSSNPSTLRELNEIQTGLIHILVAQCPAKTQKAGYTAYIEDELNVPEIFITSGIWGYQLKEAMSVIEQCGKRIGDAVLNAKGDSLRKMILETYWFGMHEEIMPLLSEIGLNNNEDSESIAAFRKSVCKTIRNNIRLSIKRLKTNAITQRQMEEFVGIKKAILRSVSSVLSNYSGIQNLQKGE